MLPLLQPLVLLRGRGVPIGGNKEGDWKGARMRPEGIVGPAPGAELERATMAAEIAHI